MRIVGIDPGTRHMGWGVVRAEGTRLHCEGYGIVHMSQQAPLAARLVQIEEGLRAVLMQFEPTQAAVEALFYAKDPQAASKLGHARGVVLLVLAKEAIEIHEYEPARVKRAVTGRGRADKHQVSMMVKALLGIRDTPGLDATDALAAAITHAQYARMNRVLREARS
jgi:crossover junction endodeoxyribonuclease RuvC